MTDKEMCAIFAKNLTDIMSDKSIRQADIVRELNVAKGTVSGWCAGTNIPRTDTLSRLTQLLEVNLSDLLTEKKPTPVSESGLPSDDELVKLWLELSPEEAQMVKAFVQGMIANRKEPPSLSE